jgi:hypothetical protein
MMTKSTTATLMVTNTRLTRAETLIPKQITPVRISTIAAATRLCPSL